jgi:transcriptional regulator with PAS, ATPase and Fis domain
MKEGEFRYDLFYRLNVIPLVIPPLRERKEDIPLIMKYVLQKCTSKLNKSIIGFSPEANDILLNYYWQGNIRELENTIEYAVNMENSGFISANNLPAKFKRNKDKPSNTEGLVSVKNLEKEAILNALSTYGYKNKTAAAKAIGMSRATFYRKLKEYDIFSR